MSLPELSYVLPLKSDRPVRELGPYLGELLAVLDDVIVVDGSAPDVFAAHDAAWPEGVRHLPVDEARRTPMGKVGGVLTGLEGARHDAVLIADDDVRWDAGGLARMAALLREAEVVRPQNHFTELPWHARWDTGRTLLNRMTGGDWPGTIGVRRSALAWAGGYDGSVMFENLELVRTVVAGGGRELVPLDLFAARQPPPTRQFLDQRVRQAYDELARPVRLLVWLAVAPAVVVGGRRAAVALAAATVALAEAGRRRAGGRRVYERTAALWALAWVAERAVTSWLALASRLAFGGVRYRGAVLRSPATPLRVLRQRAAASAAQRAPDAPATPSYR